MAMDRFIEREFYDNPVQEATEGIASFSILLQFSTECITHVIF